MVKRRVVQPFLCVVPFRTLWTDDADTRAGTVSCQLTLLHLSRRRAVQRERSTSVAVLVQAAEALRRESRFIALWHCITTLRGSVPGAMFTAAAHELRLWSQRPASEAVASTSGRAGTAGRPVAARLGTSRPARLSVTSLATGWCENAPRLRVARSAAKSFLLFRASSRLIPRVLAACRSTSCEGAGAGTPAETVGPGKALLWGRSKQRPRREPAAPDAHGPAVPSQIGGESALRWPPSRRRGGASTFGLRRGPRRRNTSASFILGKMLKSSPQAASPDVKAAAQAEPSATSASATPRGAPQPLPAGERVLDNKMYQRRIPIYVMLPLNTVTREGQLQNVKALAVGFQVSCPVGRAAELAVLLYSTASTQFDSHRLLYRRSNKSGLTVSWLMCGGASSRGSGRRNTTGQRISS